MKFSVEVASHNENQVTFQMNFFKPEAISSSNQNDRVAMRVMEMSLFKSKRMRMLTADAFASPDGIIWKQVPPIIDA